MDIFLWIFSVVSVAALIYFYYRQKNKEMTAVMSGYCPKCLSFGLESEKLGGVSSCSGVGEYLVKCKECGYESIYTLSLGGGCGSGRCGK